MVNRAENEQQQDGGAKRSAGKKMSKAKPAKGPSGSKSAKTASKSKSASKGKATKKTGSKTPKNIRAEGKGRYFKTTDASGASYGRYAGGTPKQAASKAYTKLLQKHKSEGKKAPASSIIYIRESTRGMGRKVYGYQASRIKLDKPQELQIKDKNTGKTKTITYLYRNKIKKVQVPEQFGGAKSKKSAAALKKKKSVKKSSGSKTAKPKTVKKTSAKKPAKSGSKKAPAKAN